MKGFTSTFDPSFPGFGGAGNEIVSRQRFCPDTTAGQGCSALAEGRRLKCSNPRRYPVPHQADWRVSERSCGRRGALRGLLRDDGEFDAGATDANAVDWPGRGRGEVDIKLLGFLLKCSLFPNSHKQTGIFLLMHIESFRGLF